MQVRSNIIRIPSDAEHTEAEMIASLASPSMPGADHALYEAKRSGRNRVVTLSVRSLCSQSMEFSNWGWEQIAKEHQGVNVVVLFR
ncbi:hypothetical protein DK847_00160 [Aestuariivirga litoralis]|uniref:Uncharacterized protein n=1 Tax=Aestuariivirga litoralis TaxID=2650924 RepID=A0A2W2BXU9_9HYPH|nr:hypothetical protein DK847_00160 [Aestuariivirga litoralis]